MGVGKYEGPWNDDGVPHGFGIWTGDDGSSYEGEWKDGLRHGNGIHIFDGCRYEGEWKDDFKCGHGEIVTANGFRYIGDWRGDHYHGKGTYHDPEGHTYEGEWKYGKSHGYGVVRYSAGSSYEGFWKDGMKHGKGFEIDTNGNRIDCKYKKDKMILSKVKITFPENSEFLEFVGSMSSKFSPKKGKLTSVNGIVYEGKLGEGVTLVGKGKMVFSNGYRYVGEFSDDGTTIFQETMNGYGKMFTEDGEIVYQGLWKDGQPIGEEADKGSFGILGQENSPIGMMRLVNSETGEQVHMPGLTAFGGGDILAHSEFVDFEDPKTGEVSKILKLPDYVGDMDPGIRDENDRYLGQIKFLDQIKGSSKKVDEAELRLPDMSKYVGEVSGINPHGTGTLSFDLGSEFDGVKISGKWDNGLFSSGGIYFHNGFLKGEFENGLPREVTLYSFNGKDRFSEGKIDTIIKELDEVLGKDQLHGLSFAYHWQEWLTNYLENLSREYEKSRRREWIDGLLEEDESQILEFKSSIWATYRNDTGELVEGAPKNLKTEDSVIKTIAAFLNTEGGTLVIGIQDRPERRIVGIEGDFPYSGKAKDIENFQNSISELVRNSTGEDSIMGTYVNIEISEISGKKVCLIAVKKRAPEKWTWANVKTIDGGNPIKEAFFVRSGPQTKLLKSPSSAHEWRSSSEGMRDEWIFE